MDGVVGGVGAAASFAMSEGPFIVMGPASRNDEEAESNPLYAAIKKFDPDDISSISKHVSEEAIEAMRRSLVGILGNLPAETFEVQITSEKNGLRQLLVSALTTGYSIRNAEFRMVLNARFSPTVPLYGQSGSDQSVSDEPDFLKLVPLRTGVKRENISGRVSWWDTTAGESKEMDVESYVSRLEAEVDLLRDRLSANEQHDPVKNGLLRYMRTLSQDKLLGLQAGISELATKAMKGVVSQLLGVIPNVTYSISRDYLAQLNLWCLMIGYHIRDLEKRHEIMETFLASGDSPMGSSGTENPPLKGSDSSSTNSPTPKDDIGQPS
uniref:Uncharacterized protein n=1 Tax=Compsopogon caeruleus TaxID=31354 RepID=A0A7S1XDN7_9RHOD